MSHRRDNNQEKAGFQVEASSRWLQMEGAKAEWWEITQYECIRVPDMNKLFQTSGYYIFLAAPAQSL